MASKKALKPKVFVTDVTREALDLVADSAPGPDEAVEPTAGPEGDAKAPWPKHLHPFPSGGAQ